MTCLGLDRLLQRILTYLFYGLVIITPLLWSATTSELFEFPKMLAVYIFSILITATWILRMVTTQTLLIKLTPFDLPLLLFLAAQVLSTIFSIDPHTSIHGYYSRFHGGLLSTISYLALYFAAVANLDRTHARRLILAFVISAVLGCLYAFPEHFGISPSCVLITSKFNVSCWVQDVQTRIFGTFGQPNWLAAYIISIIFIPLTYLVQPRHSLSSRLKSPTTYAWIAVIILLFLTLLFTKSRSGVIGLSLGFAIFWATHLAFSQYKKRLLAWLGIVTTSLFLLFLIFGKFVIPQFDSFLASLSRPGSPPATAPAVAPAPPPSGTQLESGGTESSRIRGIVWTGAIDLFLRYPLFGSGVETFAYGYYNVRPVAHNLVSEWDFLYNKAHNEYLNLLSTTGLFGFAAFSFILITFTIFVLSLLIKPPPSPTSRSPLSLTTFFPRLAHRLFKHPSLDFDQSLVISLFSGWWALQASNFLGFSTVPVALVFYLFPALSLGITGRTGLFLDPPPQTVKHFRRPLTNLQSIGLTLVLITGIFLLTQVYSLYRADRAYAAGKAYLDQQELLNAISYFEEAIKLNPRQPLYTDQMSLALAQAAAILHYSDQSTQAAQIARQAVILSNNTIDLNRVHLNYYKTRARVFLHLAALDPQYLHQAQQTLETSAQLSPTDPKIVYNLGLIQEQMGHPDAALKLYLISVELKPNYPDVRIALSNLYESQGDLENAALQYRYILERINPTDKTAIEQLHRLTQATNSAQIE